MPVTNLTQPALPSFFKLDEPALLFHPDRLDDRDIHPLRGLLTFGPYSRGTFLAPQDPIRIAFVGPQEAFEKLESLVNELRGTLRPQERTAYLPQFPGFSAVFGIGLSIPPKNATTNIVIEENAIERALSAPDAHHQFENLLHNSIRRLASQRSEFDVIYVYLPTRLSETFTHENEEGRRTFDLHDSVKALSASLGLPLQMINDDALTYRCRCSVGWRLSIAIYSKAGGIPFKLSGFDDRNAYVGLSYCIREGQEPRFVTCCSQIFDSSGTGLQFLVYESPDGRYEGKNPYLPRDEMFKLMARTKSLYLHQKGFLPKRLVIHKSNAFTNSEIDGCRDALTGIDDIELLSVGQSSSWFGIKIEQPRTPQQKGTPAAYPIDRGTLLPMGSYEYLLWTQGNIQLSGKNYFKEGKGVPHPIFLTRHVGRGSFHESAREILALTKMNWNNDALYDFLPVTMGFASTLARIVKRINNLSSIPYDYRYFM